MNPFRNEYSLSPLDQRSNVRCASFEALYGRKYRSPIMWAEIKDRLKALRDLQKSYADKRRKPLEFSVGDYILLKVSPWKGVVRFGKKGKIAPRFVGLFEIVEKVGPVAYRLRLPEEFNGVHETFHVSNLKKCLADPTLQVPLDEIQVDAKLNFVEEPVEIVDREFKKLKRSRIVIVKGHVGCVGEVSEWLCTAQVQGNMWGEGWIVVAGKSVVFVMTRYPRLVQFTCKTLASLKVRLTISLQDGIIRESVTMFPRSKNKENDKNEVQYFLRISLTIYLNTPTLFLQLVDEHTAEIFSSLPNIHP
nr:putative reverse transcriptase domain-containing protein [Tanacetum cinerariifolium]